MKKRLVILISTYRSGSSSKIHEMTLERGCGHNHGEIFACEYIVDPVTDRLKTIMPWKDESKFPVFADNDSFKLQIDTLIADPSLIDLLMGEYDCHIELLYRGGLWDQLLSFIKPHLAAEQFAGIRVKDEKHIKDNWYHTAYPKILELDFHAMNEQYLGKVHAMYENYVAMQKYVHLGRVHKYENLYKPRGRLSTPHLVINYPTEKQYAMTRYWFHKLISDTSVFDFDPTIPLEYTPKRYR